MEYFKIADKYYQQTNHYKDKRSPPWIKLHNNLLEDYEFIQLSDQERYHFLASMMLASRSHNKIVYDSKWVMRKIESTSEVNLDKLLEKNFIIKINELGEEIVDASIPLAECPQVADTIEEREEKERKKEKQEKERKPKTIVTKKNTIEILKFLNEKAGKKYLPTDVNLNFIKMRLCELIKFKTLAEAIEDCKQVIVIKRKEWEGEEKMHGYLRPATLFNKTKFSQYQGEINKTKIKTISKYWKCSECRANVLNMYDECPLCSTEKKVVAHA